MLQRICEHSNCRNRVELPQRYCEEHSSHSDKQYNKHVRMNEFNKKYDAFYHSNQWREVRKHKLLLTPLCEVCTMDGRVTPAQMVHHKIELRSPNGWEKRLDLDNLESICYECHNKQDHSYSWKNRKRLK